MSKKHPEAATLDQFLAGGLTRQDNLKVSWHLYNCATCRRRAEEVTPRAGEIVAALFTGLEPQHVADAVDYGAVIARTYGALLEREADLRRDRARAPELFAELMRHPVSRQRVFIQNTRRFQTWGLAEFLLERASEAWLSDPRRAEDLAELAVEVSSQLEASFYGAGLIKDIAARSWSYVANARRIGSDLHGADESMKTAEADLREGTGDPLERARILDLKASLRCDQRRFKEAEKLLERSISIYQKAEDAHMAGRSMIKLAKVLNEGGTPERATEALEKAVGLIDPKREPRLDLLARHNLVCNLTESDRYMEAQALLAKSRDLYREHGDPSMQLRYLWLQGQIAQGLGQLDQAEATFLKARAGFNEQGMTYDAALVSLELATTYAQQGRTAEIKGLAQEMLPVFQSLDIRREATATLILFEQAAKAEKLTLAMVREIASKLKQSLTQPATRSEMVS